MQLARVIEAIDFVHTTDFDCSFCYWDLFGLWDISYCKIDWIKESKSFLLLSGVMLRVLSLWPGDNGFSNSLEIIFNVLLESLFFCSDLGWRLDDFDFKSSIMSLLSDPSKSTQAKGCHKGETSLCFAKWFILGPNVLVCCSLFILIRGSCHKFIIS